MIMETLRDIKSMKYLLLRGSQFFKASVSHEKLVIRHMLREYTSPLLKRCCLGAKVSSQTGIRSLDAAMEFIGYCINCDTQRWYLLAVRGYFTSSRKVTAKHPIF